MGVFKPWVHIARSALRSRRGLSLIELLVVIGIIAVLIAILMTTFGAAIRMVRSFR